ncbi:MAG: hypothetical protein RLZZ165_1077 [Bacteroidota bacterium]
MVGHRRVRNEHRSKLYDGGKPNGFLASLFPVQDRISLPSMVRNYSGFGRSLLAHGMYQRAIPPLSIHTEERHPNDSFGKPYFSVIRYAREACREYTPLGRTPVGGCDDFPISIVVMDGRNLQHSNLSTNRIRHQSVPIPLPIG